MHAVVVAAGLQALLGGTVAPIGPIGRAVGHRVAPGIEQFGPVTGRHPYLVQLGNRDGIETDGHLGRPPGTGSRADGCCRQGQAGQGSGSQAAGQHLAASGTSQIEKMGIGTGIAATGVVEVFHGSLVAKIVHCSRPM